MQLGDLEQSLLRLAARAPRMKVAVDAADEELQATAGELLRDEHTTATGCYRSVQAICGSGFRAWEPESIWLTLERRGVDVPLLNRDKILAAATLTVIPAFWFEVNAFENTIMAFNNVISDGEILQEATPAQINWAVYEAEMLFGQTDDVQETAEFDREPVRYTALVLHRSGFILTPELLTFAQDELDALNKDGVRTSKSEIRSAWDKLKRADFRTREFTESPLDTQLGRLSAVQLYMMDRLEQYESDLSRLRL